VYLAIYKDTTTTAAAAAAADADAAATTTTTAANFVVKQPSYLSDRSAIVARLNLNTSLPASETQTSTSTNRLISLPRQFCWENDSYLKFRNALRTEPIQILIREFMERNTEDVKLMSRWTML